MILGCDIGTSVTKGVLLDEGELRCAVRVPTEANPDQAMERVLADLREHQQIERADIDKIAITGWGESRVTMEHTPQSMLNCLARAAVREHPDCRSVLCLGAQQSVILSVNDKGRVMEYRMNDKCASGCGKFLEVIFEALEIEVDESAGIAKDADKKLALSGQCAVFYESDVVSLINAGESVANITEAIFGALTKTIGTLCKKIKTKDALVVAGGLANNERILDGVGGVLGRPLRAFGAEPDLIGAIGAAISMNGTR